MKSFKKFATLALVYILIPVSVWAVWPTTNVDTTAMDSDLDTPQGWRAASFDGWTKFNEIRTHVSTYIQGLLDDADAATARTTLGAAASGANTDITSLSGVTLNGTTNLTGDLSSTKACAANYVRVSPNLCLKETNVTPTALTRDACTDIAEPSGAKALVVYFRATVGAGNAVSTRVTDIEAHFTSDCSDVIKAIFALDAREEVAVTAGVKLAEVQSTQLVPLSSGQVWLQFSDDIGNNGSAFYEIRGYYD